MAKDIEFKPRAMTGGRFGIIYALNSKVVVKVDRLPKKSNEGEAGLKEEQECYIRLADGAADRQIPCPYIISVFYHAPLKGIFMHRTPRDLRRVMKATDDKNQPTYRYEPERVFRWMGQLCGAMAFLVEMHKMVHGDLHPDNILVDEHDNLKVTDLATWWPVGKDLPVVGEPWGRMLGALDGVDPDGHVYGPAGARTESFAIGSVYYSLIRGHYPYEHEKYGFMELLRKFQNKEFPVLCDSPEDAIIGRCWNEEYADDTSSLSALEQEFRNKKDGTEWYRPDLEDPAWFDEMQQACRSWTDNGHLYKLLAERDH